MHPPMGGICLLWSSSTVGTSFSLRALTLERPVSSIIFRAALPLASKRARRINSACYNRPFNA